MPAAFVDSPQLTIVLLGGSFIPYTELGAELSANSLPSPCERYESHRDYKTAVRRAAKYAVKHRWALRDEVRPMLAAAEAKAAQHPRCVPAP